MGYAGYLVRVGGFIIPMDSIYADSYKIVKTYIDLDPFRDAEGKLNRHALANTPSKIEFKLKPMYDYQLRPIMAGIQSNYINQLEKKALVNFYDIEGDAYIDQYMYMPDINFQIYGVFGNIIQYDETTLKFIGY